MLDEGYMTCNRKSSFLQGTGKIVKYPIMQAFKLNSSNVHVNEKCHQDSIMMFCITLGENSSMQAILSRAKIHVGLTFSHSRSLLRTMTTSFGYSW